jgi:hypothetical protein
MIEQISEKKDEGALTRKVNRALDLYHLPSRLINLELGGTYMSRQFGQKSLTVSRPGISLLPQGTTGQD